MTGPKNTTSTFSSVYAGSHLLLLENSVKVATPQTPYRVTRFSSRAESTSLTRPACTLPAHLFSPFPLPHFPLHTRHRINPTAASQRKSSLYLTLHLQILPRCIFNLLHLTQPLQTLTFSGTSHPLSLNPSVNPPRLGNNRSTNSQTTTLK